MKEPLRDFYGAKVCVVRDTPPTQFQHTPSGSPFSQLIDPSEEPDDIGCIRIVDGTVINTEETARVYFADGITLKKVLEQVS